jgi:UDP-N-acetylglucosamine 4,6-dehydratase
MRLLISGGTGSLGLALTRHFVGSVERLVVFSRDEHKQARMHASYPDHPANLRFLLGDVRDREALVHTMHGCDTVIHAAALKRVDNISCQPIEIKKTNVDGTQNVLEAALEAGVKKVLLVSTDKAVMPENIYGATKMMAEQLTTQFNAISYPRGMRCSVVRFGNLWHSHGSVIDVWMEAAQAGKDLPITDLQMTRFVMTMGQACTFIAQALDDMEGGEIFVPQLPTMRLVDLGKAIIAVYATAPCTLVPMGLRPGGEKVHERMLSDDEPKRTLTCKSRFTIMPSHRTWSDVPYREVGMIQTSFRAIAPFTSEDAPRLSIEELALLLKTEVPER